MEYLLHLSIIILIYGGLALSLTLLVGHAGILSVAHAVWFGVGAYVAALCLLSGISFVISTFAAVAASALGACVVSVVLARIESDYYALCSFGLNICVYTILVQWTQVTHGAIGIAGIPRPVLFGYSFVSNMSFLWLIALCVGCIAVLAWWITRSHFGRVLRAIRDDENVLRVFHYSPWQFKSAIYTVTACMASLCGVLYASYVSFIDPSSFSLTESIFMLTLVAVGGFGSLPGAVAGTGIVMLIPEVLRFIAVPTEAKAEWRLLIFGGLLLYVALFCPRGFFVSRHFSHV